MKNYGLIGKSLQHSFSPDYFEKKFSKENIEGCSYNLYEFSRPKLLKEWLLEKPTVKGLNVTIPYKETVISMLDILDFKAREIGAVNTIRFQDGKTIGYNTDYFGFRRSLESFIEDAEIDKALILGTGGASKAVKVVLDDLGIESQFVSRSKKSNTITYEMLNERSYLMEKYQLIINSTPLGTHPEVHRCPEIPYKKLNSSHYLYDLVYNPAETAFMIHGIVQGAKVKNGLEMLELQAEKSWEIWNF